MNVAFLFNSDYELFNGVYGTPILEEIVKTNALNNLNRNIKISLGDILTYGVAYVNKQPTLEDFYKLNDDVYTPYTIDYLLQPKLKEISRVSTIYCVYIKNILPNTIKDIHKKLINYPPYLGGMDINYNNRLHARFFEYSLISSFRILNNTCSIFHSMDELEEIGEEVFDDKKLVFEKNSFKVIYEDIGAVDTIFDKYYANYKHLSRIQDFRDTFLKLPNINNDILDNVIISLEELHPKLFNSVSALARTYSRIETEEDIAQCSVSGRRFLEQLADHIFPPREEKFKKREVGKPHYKNRIWAYIENTIESNQLDTDLIKIIGKQADVLIEKFNSGLHSDLTQKDLNLNLVMLLNFIIELVNLSPETIRKPYLAYEDEIEEFMQELKNI